MAQHGAAISGTAPWGVDSEPLVSAIEGRRTAAVQWLLEQGARWGAASLLLAVKTGCLASVQLLLQHGLIDFSHRGLFCAARLGNVEIVQLVLEHACTVIQYRRSSRLSEEEQAAAQRALVRRLALCGAASMGQAAVVRFVLETLSTTSAAARSSPAPSTQAAAAPQEQAAAAATRAAAPQDSAGRADVLVGTGAGTSTQMMALLAEAMQAAIAPDEYRSHHHEFSSEDECWDEPGEHVPRDWAAVAELLLAYGLDPAADHAKLVTWAIQNQGEASNQVLDVLLSAPTAQTGDVRRHALAAALLHKNLSALSKVLPRMQPHGRPRHHPLSEGAVPVDRVNRVRLLLEYRFGMAGEGLTALRD